MIRAAFVDGLRRTIKAPALLLGVYALTGLMAVPLALTLRSALHDHLGSSLVADEVATGVHYDWWQEFSAQATGLGSTFTPSIIGFAAVLDNVSSVLDARPEIVPVSAALAAYLLAWTFLAGGIVDRLARQRPTRAHGFFGASGVFFFRFLRLGVPAAGAYWVIFGYLHPYLFGDWYADAVRNVNVERVAFLWRLAMYGILGLALITVNVLFDFAKIRAVVEDRRSMIGALLAALRFVLRHPLRVSGLYAVNALLFLAVLGVWAVAAPGAWVSGPSVWVAFAAGQVYILVRLFVKLHVLASQVSLFQASLAHAAYTAAPEVAWPESPAAESIQPAT